MTAHFPTAEAPSFVASQRSEPLQHAWAHASGSLQEAPDGHVRRLGSSSATVLHAVFEAQRRQQSLHL